MSDDKPELLPCPFCGSAINIKLYERETLAWAACLDCGLEAPTETGVTKDQAVAYWNKRAMPLQQRTINETTPSHNLVMQAENMLAAWERMYRLINPRDNFPKVFADLTEDMEFRELQWLRRAVAEAKPAMVAEQQTEKSGG